MLVCVFCYHWTELRANHTKKRSVAPSTAAKNTACMNFLSVFTYILLFSLLFPQKQNRKDMGSSKALPLLILIACFDVTSVSSDIDAFNWKVEAILTLMRAPKLSENGVAQQQQRSALGVLYQRKTMDLLAMLLVVYWPFRLTVSPVSNLYARLS